MGYFEAVLLGIVQGLTEFLPVSSSAHLILARLVLGWDADALGLAFDVACHVGTLLAVIVYFRRDLWAMALAAPDVFRREPGPRGRQARLIVTGTLPLVLVGVLGAASLEDSIRTPAVVAVTLVLGAIGFFAADRLGRRTRTEESLGYLDTVWIGLAQAAALVPGVSRSGATITIGMFLGLTRDAAARYSFLLGVPAILAAAGHAGIKLLKTGLTVDQALLFLVGMATSALVGYLAIDVLLKYLGRHSLAVFAWYRIALAAVVVAAMFLRV